MSTFQHNKVDIYIKEKNGKRQIRIPWLPESIKYDSGGMTAASYDILDRGEVNIPTGNGIAKFSWEGVFPGVNRKKDSLQRGTAHAPSYYHSILEDWQNKKTPLNILITGYPVNMDVYLSKYEGAPSGGFGDWQYSIELTRRIPISVTSSTNKKANSASSSKNTKRPTTTTTAYTIKKGDTLWKISVRFLGAGSRWKEIYNINKSIIESTAKKHGHKSSENGRYLYAGVKIQIPKK